METVASLPGDLWGSRDAHEPGGNRPESRGAGHATHGMWYHPADFRQGTSVRWARKLLISVAFIGIASPAWANPLDMFGATSANIAMGGGATGLAGSYDACWYNPAGLGQLDGFDLGIGTLIYRPFLKATTHAQDGTGRLVPTTSAHADTTRALMDLGLASPIPLGQKHKRLLFWGLHVAFPIGSIYAVRERPVQEAYFPFLEDRNRRLVLNAALALRWKWAMLGAGLSMLPDVIGRVDVDFTQGSQANQALVDVNMSLAPTVGAMVEPLPGLTIGFTWRGANRTYIEIPVTAVLSDKIAAVRVKVLAHDYSTPHQLALGAAYRTDRFTVAGDVTYSLYRDFQQSAPRVILYSSGTDGRIVKETRPPDARFADTFAVRVGGEYRPLRALAIRAGFGWVQSPVPAQTGITNLLDGDRFTGSLGLGFDAAGVGGPPIGVDVHVAYAGMVGHRDAKMLFEPDNPGYPYVGSEGGVLNAGMTLKVRF